MVRFVCDGQLQLQPPRKAIVLAVINTETRSSAILIQFVRAVYITSRKQKHRAA